MLKAENENEHLIKGVTRLELIDESGRAYTNLTVDNIVLSVQDEGRTLKIFVDEVKDKA
jgi:hypothetical protein